MTTKPDLSPEAVQRMLEIVEECERAAVAYTAAAERYRRAEWSASVNALKAADATLLRERGARRRFTKEIDYSTVRALLEEIVRLRKQLAPKKPSGLMAALCKDVERAQRKGARLTAHRNRALPQDPPEET